MICPRCNIELDKGICLKCGYMENGEQIEQFKKDDKYTDIRIYNDDFEQMNTNQKKYLNFLLGPLYFSFRNHIVAGTIISLFALLVLYIEMEITRYFLKIGTLCTLLAFFNITFYLVINRVSYMAFSNVICLELDKFKIKRIKKHNEDYMDKLTNHNSKSVLSIIIQLLIYVIIGILIAKIR